jgi:hypothetical protein
VSWIHCIHCMGWSLSCFNSTNKQQQDQYNVM